MSDLGYAAVVAPFHQRVGRIVRAWANAESSLWSLAQIFLGVDQFRARIVMESMPNLRARKEFLIRLSDTYLDPELLPQARALFKRIQKLSGRRNLVAHARMFVSGKADPHIAFTDQFGEDGLMFGRTEFTNKELDDMADAIESLSNDLVTFLCKLEGKVYASARIHREQPAHPILQTDHPRQATHEEPPSQPPPCRG